MKTSDIQVGDSVLVKQDLCRKASPPYEGEPLEVQHRKGTQVMVKRRDGSTVTRSTDSGGGRQMKAGARFRSQAQRRA